MNRFPRESVHRSVEIHNKLEELPEDFRELLEAQGALNYELGYAWFSNLLTTVFHDQVVKIYTLRMNGKARCLLPLTIQKQGGSTYLQSLANFYSALYAPVLDKHATVADVVWLLEHICTENRGITALRFFPLDRDATGYQLLETALRKTSWITFSYFCFGNWYLPCNDDWESYWNSRDGKLRNTVKRMKKKFFAEGGRLELIRGGDAVAEGIRAYHLVYASSWKQPEPFPEFIPGLIHGCARDGSLRLGIAWMKDVPVAAQLWIVKHGRAEIYKLAYHEDYKQFAPGSILTAFLMEEAIHNEKVSEVDYLIGDDPYKETWMSHRRERWGLIAYNPRTFSGLLGMMRKVLRRIGRKVLRRQSF